jgi:ATP/maltotriose-dependent transcriptional regulator MalT
LLETVRQYAADQLEALGPQAAEAARSAHLDYYQALADTAAPQLVGTDQAAWLDRLDAELGNLRAAVACSLTQTDAEPGLRLAASLHVYWEVRGHAAEGADALRALLDARAARRATPLRARALVVAADLLDKTGAYTVAGDYCDEALAFARAAGDENLIANVLHVQGWVLLRHGQGGASLLIEQGLGLARQLGERHLAGQLLSARCYAAYVRGDVADAARDAAEALSLFREAGDQIQVGATLGNLGYIELSAGDLDGARDHLAESLEISRALNNRDGIVYETLNLGLAEYLRGSPGAAGPLFAESLDLARRVGMKRQTAYALIGLAMARGGRAEPGWFVRLHGAADQALEDLGETIEPLESRLAETDRQRLRAAMGADAFEAEYLAGRAVDLVGVAHEAARRMQVAREAQAADTPATERDFTVLPERTVLTLRELDVLKLVAQGLSNPEIAQRLILSEHTVHRHLANLLRKLNLSSRAAAAAWGVRAGLV